MAAGADTAARQAAGAAAASSATVSAAGSGSGSSVSSTSSCLQLQQEGELQRLHGSEHRMLPVHPQSAAAVGSRMGPMVPTSGEDLVVC